MLSMLQQVLGSVLVEGLVSGVQVSLEALATPDLRGPSLLRALVMG